MFETVESKAKENIRYIFQEGWNNNNFENFNLIFHPDCVYHLSSGPINHSTIEQMKLINEFKTSFPDIRFTINNMVEEGDMVCIFLTYTGTNTGGYINFPATNRFIKVDEMLFIRMENDKIREIWGIIDNLSKYRQLGYLTI